MLYTEIHFLFKQDMMPAFFMGKNNDGKHNNK